MMSARARSPQRRAFDRYLRTGRRAAPLELKYNHNHDPENGRFTAGSGGNPASTNGQNEAPAIAVTARRTPKPPHPVVPVGPFRSAATRSDEVGAMARSVNAFVHGQARQLVAPLGDKDGTVTVTRLDGAAVQLDHPNFTVRGRLSLTPGKEEVVIALNRPTIRLGLPVASYPTRSRLFQSVSGKINYSVDKDLKVGRGIFSYTPIHKGVYTRYNSK